MNRPRSCGRGRFNNEAKCRLPSRHLPELAKPEKPSTENAAADRQRLLASWERQKARARDLDIGSRWLIELTAKIKNHDIALVLADDRDFDAHAADLRVERDRFALLVRLLEQRTLNNGTD
jgi:hypothetical protein